MSWKENIIELEHNANWPQAVQLIQSIVKEYPNDVEAYIRAIYLLHNILVEKDYSESQHDFLASLLKAYFEISYQKFSGNAEYLFFVGKILYIAEWYFGLDDDFKPMEERRAFQMQKKAHEMEKENKLYEWAYRFSIGDNLSTCLAEQILLKDKTTLKWLKLKGFPGEYILDALKRNAIR